MKCRVRIASSWLPYENPRIFTALFFPPGVVSRTHVRTRWVKHVNDRRRYTVDVAPCLGGGGGGGCGDGPPWWLECREHPDRLSSMMTPSNLVVVIISTVWFSKVRARAAKSVLVKLKCVPLFLWLMVMKIQTLRFLSLYCKWLKHRETLWVTVSNVESSTYFPPHRIWTSGNALLLKTRNYSRPQVDSARDGLRAGRCAPKAYSL